MSPAVKAPLFDSGGKSAKSLELEDGVFGVDVKPHLVHEAVRAELNAQRAGTRAAKSRGMVAGGRGKPWRQKGTGRARAGTIRAPQFTGGGAAFPPSPRDFEVKVNRKVWRAAFRGVLAEHATQGTLGLLDTSTFDAPSTKVAQALLESSGLEAPIILVAQPEEEVVIKSFRNLERVAVVVPADLEVSALVWARSLLLTESALEQVQQRAGTSKEAAQ